MFYPAGTIIKRPVLYFGNGRMTHVQNGGSLGDILGNLFKVGTKAIGRLFSGINPTKLITDVGNQAISKGKNALQSVFTARNASKAVGALAGKVINRPSGTSIQSVIKSEGEKLIKKAKKKSKAVARDIVAESTPLVKKSLAETRNQLSKNSQNMLSNLIAGDGLYLPASKPDRRRKKIMLGDGLTLLE